MKEKDIKAMIDVWSSQNIITPEQADYMKSSVAETVSEDHSSKFVGAVTYVGATALSAGALLLIASNWLFLPSIMKLFLALLLPIIPLAFAYYKLVIQGDEKHLLGRAANVFGIVLIGGAIALIEQTYNLASSIQATFWLWGLLSLPFIFAFRKGENTFLSAILIGAASLVSLYEWLDGLRADEQVAAVLFTVLVLLYAYIMYAVGASLRYVEAWHESGRVLRIGGGFIAVVMTFVMTFSFYAQLLVGGTYSDPGPTFLVSILLNILFIGFLLFVLLRAIKFEEHQFAFTIVRFFAVYVFVKYVTLFNDMLPTSLFLIIGGVLFIVGGTYLEKNRKFLMGFMGARQAPPEQPHQAPAQVPPTAPPPQNQQNYDKQ